MIRPGGVFPIDSRCAFPDSVSQKTNTGERLFDSMQPLLTAEQNAVLPRVRLARARQRYQIQMMMSTMGRPVVDLSEIFIDVDAPADTRAAADGAMAGYERRLTRTMRK